MFEFFYAPRTCALASHIVLEQSGLPYTARRLDFSTQSQCDPAYLKLNPKGRVPALATARGVLTETPAILLFVAQSAIAARLAPLDDPFALAAVQAVNSYLCSTVHVTAAHATRGSRWADDEQAIASMKRKVERNLDDCFRYIEQDVMRGPWVMGEDYSICDAYLFTMTHNFDKHGLIQLSRYSKVANHWALMHAEPTVQRVLTLENT